MSQQFRIRYSFPTLETHRIHEALAPVLDSP